MFRINLTWRGLQELYFKVHLIPQKLASNIFTAIQSWLKLPEDSWLFLTCYHKFHKIEVNNDVSAIF